MKTKMIFFLCMIVPIITYGQEKKVIPGKMTEVSISPAIFSERNNPLPALNEGTNETFEKYLCRNVSYPEEAEKANRQGTSMVRFTVSPKGEVSEFIVVNSVSTEIDEEVIRALKATSGMWIPSYINGEPVAEEKEVSVVFKHPDLGKNTDFNLLGRKYFSKGTVLFFSKNDAQKALKYYDKGIVLLPKDGGLLLLRGMARYTVGDTRGACQDWTRIKALGGLESNIYLDSLCGYKGYAEMIRILKE